jgi:hypothetical protein
MALKVSASDGVKVPSSLPSPLLTIFAHCPRVLRPSTYWLWVWA